MTAPFTFTAPPTPTPAETFDRVAIQTKVQAAIDSLVESEQEAYVPVATHRSRAAFELIGELQMAVRGAGASGYEHLFSDGAVGIRIKRK